MDLLETSENFFKQPKQHETARPASHSARTMNTLQQQNSKRIPQEKVASKLLKLQKKISDTVLQNEKRFLQAYSKRGSLMSERDKEIINRSMLGVFHERFNADEFRDQFREIRNIFAESNILSGVQPYLLYFNLPQTIIDHLHRPERLVLKSQATDAADRDG